jgi:hypothetical protein
LRAGRTDRERPTPREPTASMAPLVHFGLRRAQLPRLSVGGWPAGATSGQRGASTEPVHLLNALMPARPGSNRCHRCQRLLGSGNATNGAGNSLCCRRYQCRQTQTYSSAFQSSARQSGGRLCTPSPLRPAPAMFRPTPHQRCAPVKQVRTPIGAAHLVRHLMCECLLDRLTLGRPGAIHPGRC